MISTLPRRHFIQMSISGTALCFGTRVLNPVALFAADRPGNGPALISPGCRKSKVKVAKIYYGRPEPHWPTPTLDLQEEVNRFEAEFTRMQPEFADIDFVVDTLVTTKEEAQALTPKLSEVDGILAVKLTIGTGEILPVILDYKKPTVLFALPYSGHEWTGFGALMNSERGELLDCLLSSDFDQLAVAVRPFRAIHHLREAKILNVTERERMTEYMQTMKDRFGTELIQINLDRAMKAYEAVSDADAKAEAQRWISGAKEVREPSEEEIVKSCRLALAFERLLDEEEATTITVDCYGTMYRKLPAFPCIGFTRLNDMGLAGICESDLRSAMTFITLQGLCGRPGFISDPTMDVSNDTIILAHCLGSTKMDGPAGEQSPYRIRTIMERQEGAVTQVEMHIGKPVTQALLANADRCLYFTGKIVDVPITERGCRTKITVQIDGDSEKLWRNWTEGLHRVTCYGDVSNDLERFCRFKKIELVQEA